MPDAFRGLFLWPGVARPLRGDFTLLPGVRPSVCTLEMAPQEDAPIALDGTLTLVYGDLEIDFPGCRVDRASFDYTPDGMVWRLSIWDRRWAWQYANTVSGKWNERFATVQSVAGAPRQVGTLDQQSLQSPQALCTLCLLAMNEPAFDVSQVPNDLLPECLWDSDNAAEALDELANRLGCRVVLGADNVVRVCRVGVGAELPQDGVLRASVVLDPPDPPDSVAVLGGPLRYQVDLLLEAVGLETNGVVTPIDDLNYKPAGGWSSAGELDFWLSVEGWESDLTLPPNLQQALRIGQINPREYAKRCVYKWYRVKTSGSADNKNLPPLIPGWRGNPGTRIQALWQILPLEDAQVVGWYDALNVWHSYPAYVYGTFADSWLGTANGEPAPYTNFNSAKNSFCYYDFELDREEGVVKFAEPVYAYNADGSIGPATLYLRCTVSPRDYVTAVRDRYVRLRQLDTDQHGTGPLVLRREEITRHTAPTYDANYNVTGLTDTAQVCDAEADYYIDAALLEFQAQTPADVTYAGLLPLSPDGAITQVTWTVGPHGALTRAARNTEWNPALPTYRERQLLQALPRQGRVVQRLQDQQRREGR